MGKDELLYSSRSAVSSSGVLTKPVISSVMVAMLKSNCQNLRGVGFASVVGFESMGEFVSIVALDVKCQIMCM